MELQPRNDPLNEEAALLSRYVVGGGPDGPKLRIGEGEHVAMVFGETDPLMTVVAHDTQGEGCSRLGSMKGLLVAKGRMGTA